MGCGAIGCEMLKNFALLGVGLAKSSGEVGSLSVFPLLCLTVFALGLGNMAKNDIMIGYFYIIRYQ